MENRELDAKCAKILGWSDFREPQQWFGERFAKPPLSYGCKPQTTLRIPEYSTSLEACRELLEWANKNDYVTFIAVLWPKLLMVSDEDMYSKTIKLLLATPRQIAESFVECFGGEK